MALYGIKDSANLTLFSKDDSSGTMKYTPVLYADYCNTTSINMSADAVYAMKKTARAISWDTNREGTLTTEMQVFDLKWIALLMGSTVTNGSVDWAKREVKSLAATTTEPAEGEEGEATTTFTFSLSATPKEGSLSIYKLAADKISLGDEAVVTTDYTIDGTTVTILTEGAAAGDQYVAFYMAEVANTNSFSVSSDEFPTGYRVIFDTMIRDTDQQDKMVQFEFYNLKPHSSMDLTLSAEDVRTLSVEWDILANNENKFFDFKYL